jgi:hypothetical protein
VAQTQKIGPWVAEAEPIAAGLQQAAQVPGENVDFCG